MTWETPADFEGSGGGGPAELAEPAATPAAAAPPRARRPPGPPRGRGPPPPGPPRGRGPPGPPRGRGPPRLPRGRTPSMKPPSLVDGLDLAASEASGPPAAAASAAPARWEHRSGVSASEAAAPNKGIPTFKAPPAAGPNVVACVARLNARVSPGQRKIPRTQIRDKSTALNYALWLDEHAGEAGHILPVTDDDEPPQSISFALARHHTVVVTLGSYSVHAGLAGEDMPRAKVSPYYVSHQRDAFVFSLMCARYSRRAITSPPSSGTDVVLSPSSLWKIQWDCKMSRPARIIRAFLTPSFGPDGLPIDMFVEDTYDSMELVTLDNFNEPLMGMDRLAQLIIRAVRQALAAGFHYSDAMLDAQFACPKDPDARLMYLDLCIGANGANGHGYNCPRFKEALCRVAFDVVGCAGFTFLSNTILPLYSMGTNTGMVVDLGHRGQARINLIVEGFAVGETATCRYDTISAGEDALEVAFFDAMRHWRRDCWHDGPFQMTIWVVGGGARHNTQANDVEMVGLERRVASAFNRGTNELFGSHQYRRCKLPKVIVSSANAYASWIGGSLICSLSIFPGYWVHSSMYRESGPTIVHRICH